MTSEQRGESVGEGASGARGRSTGNASPPWLVRGLLCRVLPRDVRDDAVAELDEKFASYAASAMGPRGARRWYRRQVAGVLHPRHWTRSLGQRYGGSRREKGSRTVAMNPMQDVRFGLRMLTRNPGLTVVIVITLAVGLGFNGAIFSLANTIILNELPVDEPARVLFLDEDNPSRGRDGLRLSYLDYRDFAQATDSFASMAAWYVRNVNVSDGIEVPQRYLGSVVEPSIFDVLRVEPELGRRFGADDTMPGAEAVVLIGYNVWQTRYGADADIVGRVVQISGEPATVVGVLPAVLERTPMNPAVWTPLVPTERMLTERDRRILRAAGRLHPGASQEGATAELEQIAARLESEHRDTNEGVRIVAGTFNEMYTELGNKTITLVMLGAVVFLLLIACANVANLLVSRSMQRNREVVIRAALGASRWRIVRQLLIESALLSAIAAIFASLLAVVGARLLESAIAVAAPPEYWDFSVRPSVFVYIFALSALTSVAFGLMPALHATRRGANETLKEGSRGSGGKKARRLTGMMVVAQVALSLVLLAGAGVMVRSMLKIADIEWSIPPDNVLSMRLSLPAPNYPDATNIVAFHDQLGRGLEALPGVDAVALTSSFPGSTGFDVSAEIEGLPVSDGHPTATLSQLIVSPEYFELAGVQPLRGRLFDRRDGLDAEPVVVIERRTAERFWPDQDPLGKRLRWIGETEKRWVRVIGVIPDLHQALELDFIGIHPLVYTPFQQEPLRAMGLLVRSPMDSETLAGELRRQVQEIDANLPLFSVKPLADVILERTVGLRIASGLFGLLGFVALFLAAIGIYAVLAFAVGARQREIGIRRALGADAGEVIKLVARTSLAQTVVGLILGLVGAVGLSRVLSIFMYDVSPTDPLTFAVVFAVLTVTALCAGLLPARRASSVSPVEALRDE